MFCHTNCIVWSGQSCTSDNDTDTKIASPRLQRNTVYFRLFFIIFVDWLNHRYYNWYFGGSYVVYCGNWLVTKVWFLNQKKNRGWFLLARKSQATLVFHVNPKFWKMQHLDTAPDAHHVIFMDWCLIHFDQQINLIFESLGFVWP